MQFKTSKDTYKYLGFLGKGEFGEVFKVKNSKGYEFALKGGDVQNEIEVLQNVGTHINIIQLLDFNPSMTFIVIEYCNLGDLDSYVRRNYGLVPVVAFMGDMIAGVDFLHSLGIAHRDLKPGNILLHINPAMICPICKISDFGTSKSVCQSQQQPIINNMIPECYQSTAHSIYYTAPEINKVYMGTFCGTLNYMAPEVGKGPYNLMCDVFSLGCIFFFLLPNERQGVGNQPFLAPTIAGKTLRDATEEEISWAVMSNSGIDSTLRQMICLMLKKDFRTRAYIKDVANMYNIYQTKTIINQASVAQAITASNQMRQTPPVMYNRS